MDDYRNWCYEDEQFSANQAAHDVSQDDFQKAWAAKVAKQFSLKEEDVAAIYTDKDPYNTNNLTRIMWKDTIARGVSSTPTVFINSIRLE